MTSLVSGFEYDIFISYRQKDNKGDRWVTEFVAALKSELEATFKEDISIYFDENPHDGLLETHDVGDSLKGKLHCLIFIPILSQTYCDPRSFAWKHEFIAFRKLAAEDALAPKIRLLSGNVANRVLPICIHELDGSDKQLVEAELGTALRSIDFIYKTTGVVRPLKLKEEDPKGNLNHTFYRDQINKVARAIRELIQGIQQPGAPPLQGSGRKSSEPENVPSSSRKKISWAAASVGVLALLSFAYYYFGGFTHQLSKHSDKSIAVLPFENMTRDPEQDYFSNGIAEDILNHLTKISDLKVKSRTSTLQYKGTQKSITQIGEELSVGNVVEGSVRRVGNQVRIVVQLIDAKTDIHLWSETYNRELKDVLALQSEIAIEIASTLKAKLTDNERENIQKEASQDVTAYDYFLKARELFNNANFERRDYDNALQLVNEAIRLDPSFSRAYALKGGIWYTMGGFGVSQKIWEDSAMYFSSKAITLDPTSPDGHVIQGYVHRYLGELKASKESFREAYTLAPNDPEAASSYGYQLLAEGDEQGADLFLKSIQTRYSTKDPEYYLSFDDAYYNAGSDASIREKLLLKSSSLSPGSVTPYIRLAILYRKKGQYDKAIQAMEQAEKISPNEQGIVDILAWLYFVKNDLARAATYWAQYPQIEAGFEDSTQIIPYRHRLGMVYARLGRKKEADALVAEDFKLHSELLNGKRSLGAWANYGSVYYALAVDHAYFGRNELAVQCLDSAFHFQFYWDFGYDNDPLFSGLQAREDFKKVIRKVDDFVEFRRRAFSNAITRMEASKDLKTMLK